MLVLTPGMIGDLHRCSAPVAGGPVEGPLYSRQLVASPAAAVHSDCIILFQMMQASFVAASLSAGWLGFLPNKKQRVRVCSKKHGVDSHFGGTCWDA